MFSGTFQNTAAQRAAIRPCLRRTPGIRVDLEINLPDGTVFRTSRYLSLDAGSPSSVEVGSRELRLRQLRGDGGWLEVHARATASGVLPPFLGIAAEGGRSLWRVPLTDGPATLRVRMARAYLPA
ncbi:MAG TPA: hypothetical protein VF265_06665 [Nevskiaceae bacterium]